ncbi:hypothetical protein [Dermatobacter hominis]|uniref:hypothetical protein n=1 Tax=Dermatobacter hominis TaxID=2884263 RepID=UPI001D0F4C12|nr:hypothetical protein [Dermatobacter hominis]UDY34941.1 hypothetical protein LH044_16580 [Dermatobacter hominis]
MCTRNTFGGNDLEYTGVTQRYTYIDTGGGAPVERWFGYNSVFHESGDGTCTVGTWASAGDAGRGDRWRSAAWRCPRSG